MSVPQKLSPQTSLPVLLRSVYVHHLGGLGNIKSPPAAWWSSSGIVLRTYLKQTQSRWRRGDVPKAFCKLQTYCFQSSDHHS